MPIPMFRKDERRQRRKERGAVCGPEYMRVGSIGGHVVALMLAEYTRHFTPLRRLDCRLLNDACGLDVFEQ